MKWISSKHLIVFAIFSLSLLQSCAVFRSNIDATCVDSFANEYPAPQEALFVLPWRVTESFKLTQGNCTFESHNLSDNQHMSYDFRMPIGTPVVAARGGRVLVVIEQFKDNIDNDFDEANLIGIEHEDGLLSWYMHLTFDGALVAIDDVVLTGQVIAYSGNTGNSAYPHLHFFAQQIIEECFDAEHKTADFGRCPQIPTSFSNVSPGDTVLQEWVTYTALPY